MSKNSMMTPEQYQRKLDEIKITHLEELMKKDKIIKEKNDLIAALSGMKILNKKNDEKKQKVLAYTSTSKNSAERSQKVDAVKTHIKTLIAEIKTLKVENQQLKNIGWSCHLFAYLWTHLLHVGNYFVTYF